MLTVVQLVAVIEAGNPRWNPVQWTKHWLPAEVPAELIEDPSLVISVGPSSESYLVRHLHPDSAFINAIGLISITTSGPGWDRLIDSINRYSDDIYVVFKLNSFSSSFPLEYEGIISKYNVAVDRLGLGLLSDSCKLMQFNRMEGDSIVFNKYLAAPSVRGLAYCKAVRVDSSEVLAAKRSFVEFVMNGIEGKCPKVFSPHAPQLEGGERYWVRLYGKYDLSLGADFETGDIYYFMERQATDTVIGNLKSWRNDVKDFDCRLPFDGSRDLRTLR